MVYMDRSSFCLGNNYWGSKKTMTGSNQHQMCFTSSTLSCTITVKFKEDSHQQISVRRSFQLKSVWIQKCVSCFGAISWPAPADSHLCPANLHGQPIETLTHCLEKDKSSFFACVITLFCTIIHWTTASPSYTLYSLWLLCSIFIISIRKCSYVIGWWVKVTCTFTVFILCTWQYM